MKNELEILGLSEIKSKEQVKRLYYKKMKEYPPELYPEKFILLNQAYNKVLDLIENNKVYELEDKKERYDIHNIINSVEKCVYEKKYFLLPKMLSNLISIVGVSNFKYINSEVIEMIIRIWKADFGSEAIYISFVFEKRFIEIELYDLAKAYKRLEEHIVINS